MYKIIICFTLLVIFGCSETESDVLTSESLRSSQEILGDLHNEVLKSVLLQTDVINLPKDTESHIFKIIKKEIPTYANEYEAIHGDNFSKISQIINENKEKTFEYVVSNSGLSNELSTRLMLISYEVNRGQNVQDLDEKLRNLEDEAFEILDHDDRIIYFGASSIARASAKFWSPKDLGGEYGISYLKGIEGQVANTRGFSWGGFILSDAAGLVSSATICVVASSGACAAPNPLFGGLPTASVVGVVGGLGSSAQYAIN